MATFRVGRTARMDAKGEAILVLTPTQEQAMLTRLQERGIPITKIRFVSRTSQCAKKKN